MANGKATLAAARDSIPQSLSKGNVQEGSARCFISTFTNPSSGGVGVGEYISWGFLPRGARLMPGAKIFFSGGAVGSTATLGDPVNTSRYMVASSIATAGSVLAEAQYTNGDTFETGEGTTELRSVIGTAALPAGQKLTLVALYVTND